MSYGFNSVVANTAIETHLITWPLLSRSFAISGIDGIKLPDTNTKGTMSGYTLHVTAFHIGDLHGISPQKDTSATIHRFCTVEKILYTASCFKTSASVEPSRGVSSVVMVLLKELGSSMVCEGGLYTAESVSRQRELLE